MTITATDEVETPGLAARLVSAPCLYAPDEARGRVDDWLSDIATDQAAALGALFARFPAARTIFEGIAEASPYLFDLVRADPARAARLLRCAPETQFAALVEKTVAAVLEADSEAEAARLLRRMKSEAALLIALCDIGGVWPVMRVTKALTTIADAAVQVALRYLLMQEAARGRLLISDVERLSEESGLVILAMGKMGAGELNYSSDIDLIVFFDPDTHAVVREIEAQPFFVRLTQALARLLQQRTADGYVFRVDLRLRPDPASTPVAISIAAALGYYEREGRTWERAAMIKARPCAGDQRVAAEFVAAISPFIWRKHLDFAALTDVHDMKRRMQAFKGHGEIAVEGHNVKIGRGGIREIEFFAQTQQLIAGGRHPQLRVKPTLEALAVLEATSWITTEAKTELTAAYEFLRRVEHRLQMLADEQTHTLPETGEGVERFSRFFGYDRGEHFSRDMLFHLERVQAHYSRLFESGPSPTHQPAVDYRAGADDGRLLEHLAALGFKKPKMVATSLEAWLRGDYRALRVESTRQAFEAFIPALVEGLAQAEDPDAAIVAFDRFLAALQRGGRLIGLLGQNPDLVGLLALILGAAPRLGDMLARQPQIIDGLVDPRFFGPIPSRRELSGRLAAQLADAGSYEEFLDRLRLFGQESLFLIGARILSGTVSAQQAGTAFADAAEGIVRTVHGLVAQQFAGQYGTIKDQQTAILAMGKLGSREMTAASDLDLILIYDFDPDHPDSDGRRSLHGGQYFARLTQRLVSAFTIRTNFGILYEIDLRLRPSGRAGPVASRLDAFESYQEHEAWTWEHMALTRARVVSAPPALKARIERVIRHVLTRPRDHDLVASDVLEMRRAIGEERGELDVWDLKYAAGGVMDIEFIAQYLQLVNAAEQPDILSVNTLQVIESALRLGLLPSATADALRSAGRLYHDLTQILRLCVSDRFVPAAAGDDLLRMLARAGDAPNFSALEARVRETEADVREIFLDLLQRRPRA
ncbi:MAG: bifunctional [glutamine synthetase] adenylyltransferase/[glutamine synthetase]-adenylyl-L-tyrosine phosphorylase [Xanthobacteraceae bacterium]